jgi:hypothetical protein
MHEEMSEAGKIFLVTKAKAVAQVSKILLNLKVG